MLTRLYASDRDLIIRHLLALPAEDRLLRFGFRAPDESIYAYVDRINFINDDVFGVYGNDGKNLIGLLHLSIYKASDCVPVFLAEAGLSVQSQYQGHGMGNLMLEQAIQACEEEGVGKLFLYFNLRNIKIKKLAIKNHAIVSVDMEDCEAVIDILGPCAAINIIGQVDSAVFATEM